MSTAVECTANNVCSKQQSSSDAAVFLLTAAQPLTHLLMLCFKMMLFYTVLIQLFNYQLKLKRENEYTTFVYMIMPKLV